MMQFPIDLVKIIAEFSDCHETKILAEIFKKPEFTYINRNVNFAMVEKYGLDIKKIEGLYNYDSNV